MLLCDLSCSHVCRLLFVCFRMLLLYHCSNKKLFTSSLTCSSGWGFQEFTALSLLTCLVCRYPFLSHVYNLIISTIGELFWIAKKSAHKFTPNFSNSCNNIFFSFHLICIEIFKEIHIHTVSIEDYGQKSYQQH